jgi:hypothetical protein
VEELARHWFNARQPKDLSKAIDYSKQAADQALAALAPGDALGLYAQAQDLLSQSPAPDSALQLDLSIGLGTAQRQIGDPSFRHTLLDAAHQAIAADDTERLVAAALANNRGMHSSGNGIDAERVAVLETALDRIPETHIDRALVLSTLCTELSVGSSLGRRQELADEALALAKSSGDEITQLQVLNNVSSPLLVPPLIDQMLEHTADALHRAEQVGDPVLQFWAINWRLHAATIAGNIDERDRCSENLKSLAERLDQPTLHWISSLNSAVRALIAGDIEEATYRSTDALKLGIESGEPDAEAIHNAQLSPISGFRGTRGELISLFEDMADSNEFVSE